MGDLTNASHGLVHFITRRTFENYLLNHQAIAAVLSEADKEQGGGLTEKDVKAWMLAKARNPAFYDPNLGDWATTVQAPKMLVQLFNDLTNSRVAYDKVRHGFLLTDWIIKNSPADFQDLANHLLAILEPIRQKPSASKL
jgi:hypothetical protein